MAEPAHTAVLQGCARSITNLCKMSPASCARAKLIHKSSNNLGALPRIENYVGLRIESNDSVGNIEQKINQKLHSFS